MRQYWTSFATSGVPKAKNAPAWKPSVVNATNTRLLLQPSEDGKIGMENIGKDLTARCNAWHQLSNELQV
jgi:hypothetical protein